MKIAAPLFFVSTSALETSTTAKSLLSAVGHRNVSQMEALVQRLADESVAVDAWKFDEDIRKALDAIRHIFVGSIQSNLKEAHRTDQEFLNCETQRCFGACRDTYKKSRAGCEGMDAQCNALEDEHVKCRGNVYSGYLSMAKSCGDLRCFINGYVPPVCTPESCLCPGLDKCHTKDASGECKTAIEACTGNFGQWLNGMIADFTQDYAAWSRLHTQCTVDYKAFLTLDMNCDSTQKHFEACKCTQRSCDAAACSVELETCETACWASYEKHVTETQCLEKDRKIDWSATKKIECFVDILLHQYTEEELTLKCGTKDCVNVAREQDYKHCHTICTEVDHDGEWPKVNSVALACEDASAYQVLAVNQTVHIAGHQKRDHHDQYHLGDGTFACDANGPEVFTKHRSETVKRPDEHRCTEHLDIDYQVPPCCECDPVFPEVCDAAFHAKHYCQFDDHSVIDNIHPCCAAGCPKDCFSASPLTSTFLAQPTAGSFECSVEETMHTVDVREHSHVWAYNRCPCTECAQLPPKYDARPERHYCGAGVHTFGTQTGY